MKSSSKIKYHLNLIGEALLFPILKLGIVIAFIFFYAYRLLPESIHSIVRLSCITVLVIHVGFKYMFIVSASKNLLFPKF